MTVVDSVEKAVETAVADVKSEVAKVDSRVRVDLTDAEKFVVSQLENTFLKAQVEAQQLQTRLADLDKQAQSVRQSFVNKTEELAKQYGVDLKDYIYNAMEFAFTKKSVPTPAPATQTESK